jgi:hypothetical protein
MNANTSTTEIRALKWREAEPKTAFHCAELSFTEQVKQLAIFLMCIVTIV